MVLAASAQAFDVYLYMDTAPNRYGSPDWGPWWEAAKADVAAGKFVNMRSGWYPGTNKFIATEAIVYSTGDLGKRLHWIYWIPNATIEALQNAQFQAKQVMDWDGTDYAWGTDVDTPEVGWYTPSSWVAYEGGVIGTFGNAWWAYDDLAQPGDTNGNPYDETDAADIAALAAEMYRYQTHSTGLVRWYEGCALKTLTLRGELAPVPEPFTIVLASLGLGSVAGFRRLRRG
jgi:hypothetical protein